MLRACSRSLLCAAVLAAGCVPDPDIKVPDFSVTGSTDGGTPAQDMGDMTSAPAWQAGKSGVTNSLRGVWASDAALTAVYVVGHEGVILRGSGVQSFTAETSGTTENLYAVLGASAEDVYAVGGNGLILHRQGGKWSVEGADLKLGRPLYALYSPAAGDVYAVGDRGTIVHRTGGAWKVETAPGTADLRAVAGKSADEVYAVGTGGAIWRRSGNAWSSDTAMQQETGNFYALAVLDGTYYAAGEYALVLRRDADKWATEATIKPAPMMGVPPHFYGLYGGAGELIAVGGAGAVQRRAGAPGMAVWTQEKSGVTGDLSAVAGVAPRSIVAVGAQGAVARRF